MMEDQAYPEPFWEALDASEALGPLCRLRCCLALARRCCHLPEASRGVWTAGADRRHLVAAALDLLPRCDVELACGAPVESDIHNRPRVSLYEHTLVSVWRPGRYVPGETHGRGVAWEALLAGSLTAPELRATETHLWRHLCQSGVWGAFSPPTSSVLSPEWPRQLKPPKSPKPPDLPRPLDPPESPSRSEPPEPPEPPGPLRPLELSRPPVPPEQPKKPMPPEPNKPPDRPEPSEPPNPPGHLEPPEPPKPPKATELPESPKPPDRPEPPKPPEATKPGHPPEQLVLLELPRPPEPPRALERLEAIGAQEPSQPPELLPESLEPPQVEAMMAC
ncbi:extensin-like [Pollicipes pollicipes]|uniref:extensin-like n=1 Tax=Pollicipes pollicipes TaxID=41117 RepID=UPI001885189D|nr:extensin-like [Pollicipes pollicipes]